MGEAQVANKTSNVRKKQTNEINGSAGSAIAEAAPSAVAALAMLGLVFGGCCSNVGAETPLDGRLARSANIVSQ